MTLDINTFGKTPAANYLARALNEIDDRRISRSCTIRINSFNNNIEEIFRSVEENCMSTKTAANLCRLLRQEASQVYIDQSNWDDGYGLIDNLVQNVIIGKIKTLTRRLGILRKIEIGSCNEDKIKTHGKATVYDKAVNSSTYTICGYVAGIVYEMDDAPNRFYKIPPELSDIKDDITADYLHKKSFIKCKKQGKDWTKMNHYDFTEISKVLPFRN